MLPFAAQLDSHHHSLSQGTLSQVLPQITQKEGASKEKHRANEEVKEIR